MNQIDKPKSFPKTVHDVLMLSEEEAKRILIQLVESFEDYGRDCAVLFGKDGKVEEVLSREDFNNETLRND